MNGGERYDITIRMFKNFEPLILMPLSTYAIGTAISVAIVVDTMVTLKLLTSVLQ